jgi:hypothetical protein
MARSKSKQTLMQMKRQVKHKKKKKALKAKVAELERKKSDG